MNKELMSNETHIFFWNGIYSNWHTAPFTYKGERFENSEQAFMWEKANFFNDSNIADKVLKTPNPRDNKKLGRQVSNFDPIKWTAASYNIMYEVNVAKFEQNPTFKAKLIETEGKTLVESSPYDKIWGIGMMDHEAINVTEAEWKGKNLLGKVLTQLRNSY